MASIPIKYLTRLSRKVVVPTDLHGEVFHYSLPAWHDTGDGAVEQVTDIASAKLLLEGGEVLVSKLNPERGAVIHADKHRIPTVCSPEFIALKPRLVDARYTYYLMLSGPVRACLESSVESVTNSHKRARVDRFLASRVEVPDLSTQKAIADFLDRETVRIDQLIEKKGRLVEALQSKRISLISEAVTTGIDDSLDLVETNSQFVPKIPHGWKLWRLKHLADVRGGLTIGRAVPIERPVFPVSYLRVANVQAGWIDLSDVAETHVTSAEVEKYSLAEGDVLMNEGGDNDKLGRGAVWTAPFHPCLHQNHVFCVRPRERHYAEWISLATNAQYARDFFFLHSNQSTNLASISRSNLQQFPVAIPPHGEMRDLLSRVHAALARIDRVISAVRTSIEGLREFRSALITAAVTGQMDVTTWGRRGETDRRLERIEEEMSAAPGRGEVVAAS